MSTKLIQLTLLFFCLAKTVNASLEYGDAELQGTRNKTIEDRTIVDAELADGNFFAILDGHGGAEVSNYAKNNLIPFLKKNINFDSTDFAYELQRGIVNFDVELFNEKIGMRSGTTLCGVYVEGNKLYCANLGDSRAVLYGRSGVQPLSGDHKPQSEIRRIALAGGSVFQRPNGGIYVSKDYDSIHSVASGRALGDAFDGLKNVDELKVIEVGTLLENFPNHPVGNVPDIGVVELTDEHEFIVIASDGMWDVMKNEEVGSFIKDSLCAGKRLEEVAKMLATRAQKRSSDDISVVIVTVNKDDVLRSRNWNDNSWRVTEEGIKTFSGFEFTEEKEKDLTALRMKKQKQEEENKARNWERIQQGVQKRATEKRKKVITIAGLGLGVAGVGAGIWHWEKISKWWKNRTKKNKDK